MERIPKKELVACSRQFGKTDTVKAMIENELKVQCPRCKTTEKPVASCNSYGNVVWCSQCSATTDYYDTIEDAERAWDNQILLNRKQRRRRI